MKSTGLGTKLLVGGLALLIIPLCALGVFTVQWASKSMDSLEREQLSMLRKVVADQVRIMLDEQTRMLVNASSNDSVILEVVNNLDQTGMVDLAQYKLDTRSTVFHDKMIYKTFLITDLEGKVIGDTSGGSHKGVSLAGEDFFKKAAAGQTVVGKVVPSDKPGESYVYVAGPMKSAKKGVIGTLVLGWKLEPLIKKVGELKLGSTGYAFLVDDTGRIIAHPDRKMTAGVRVEKGIQGMEEAAKTLLSFKEGMEEFSSQGDDKIIAYTPVQGARWALGLVISKQDLLSPIHRMRNITAMASGAVILFAGLLIAWLVRRMITKPITRIVRELSNGSEQLSLASTQISSSSQMLAEGASEQAASLEETSASLDEVASMTRQNADHAVNADHLMKGANEVVKKANASMGDLTTAMKEISATSEEISKIIKTIDEIAFQTNLLALNAAVEAARAGDAGAGFAVVAGEVRNLAMRAAEAARATSDLIEGTVRKIQQGSELVGKTSEAFSQVAKGAHEVGTIVSEIALASGQQSQGIEQVSEAVAEMDRVVQQNAASAEESASASEELSAQSRQMEEIVDALVRLVGGVAGDDAGKMSEEEVLVPQGEGVEGVPGHGRIRSGLIEMRPERLIAGKASHLGES
ncbi:MAG: Cache 3/Cache 2 fusion domain-containing protein [Deltaproteobacteria bacterium]|nr:Cache 3/Cache 2 fusion domain-containing protein [Deltaproteobacteria bacterium]